MLMFKNNLELILLYRKATQVMVWAISYPKFKLWD
jgi:hypothetical protein